MTEDLNMTGDDYNVALFTFFITYILFEVGLANDDPSLKDSADIESTFRSRATSS